MPKRFKDYLTDQTASYTIALCAAVALFMGLSNLDFVVNIWRNIIAVLSPFIYAFAFSFILNRPVMWFEKKVFPKSKRKKGLSIFFVYVLAITFIGSLLMAVIPQLGLSVSYMIDTIPGDLMRLYDKVMQLLNEFHWSQELISQIEALWESFMTMITDFSLTAIPGIFSFTFSLGNGLIDLVMILIISVYMSAGKDRLIKQFKKAIYAYLNPARADRLVEIGRRANNIFAGFIIGKLIDSIIIGMLCFFGMLFIYPDYTVLIAVIIGVTNMIPFFGPFIGAIPSIFIMLMISPMKAVILALFILALQQFDGNILGPKILGDSLGISPLWVLVGILVGNGLFGILGMLIGVPTFALLYNLVSENIMTRLNNRGLSDNFE